MDNEKEITVTLHNEKNLFSAIEKIFKFYFRCVIVEAFIYINDSTKTPIPELKNLSSKISCSPISQMVANMKIEMKKKYYKNKLFNGRSK